MSGLQRTIELQDVDEEAFLVYKDRLIAYLERFVSELVVKHHDIAATLRALPPERVADLLALAARWEVADAVPDGATVPDEQTDQPVAVSAATGEKLALGEGRWSGLWSWFVGGRGHPCQADLLRTRARKAIPDLLASVDELRDRLQDAKQRIAELETAIRRLDGEHRRAGETRAKAQGREEQLTETGDRRDAAIVELQRFAATGLLQLGCAVEVPDTGGPWPPTRPCGSPAAPRSASSTSTTGTRRGAAHRMRSPATTPICRRRCRGTATTRWPARRSRTSSRPQRVVPCSSSISALRDVGALIGLLGP
ncbi:DUF2397 family protein [Actinomadura madurae]